MAQRASRRNETLDLMKCVAIYSVIFLHILLPGPIGQAVNCLARFAVPLFFLSSGYFSWNSDGRTLARRAGRTGKLLLEVCAFLLAFGCVLALRRGETAAAYLRGRLDPFFLKEILLYQVLPLPYAWPMWFLTSLFFIYLLWWAMTAAARRMGKKLPLGALAALAVGLLAIHLSLGEVRGLLGLSPVNSLWLRNAWLDGFPFFVLGAWMGERGGKTGGEAADGLLVGGGAPVRPAIPDGEEAGWQCGPVSGLCPDRHAAAGHRHPQPPGLQPPAPKDPLFLRQAAHLLYVRPPHPHLRCDRGVAGPSTCLCMALGPAGGAALRGGVADDPDGPAPVRPVRGTEPCRGRKKGAENP